MKKNWGKKLAPIEVALKKRYKNKIILRKNLGNKKLGIKIEAQDPSFR